MKLVHNFPNIISSSQLINQVRETHTMVLKMDLTSLEESIRKHEWYRLRNVPIDEIGFNVCNDARVFEYSQLNVSTMPPIVLGQRQANNQYELIDGWHRINAATKRGGLFISSYLPDNR